MFWIVKYLDGLDKKLAAEIWHNDNEEQPEQLTTASSEHLVEKLSIP